MATSAYVGNLENGGNIPQSSSLFYGDCLAAFGAAEKEAAMVLGDRGEVLFCSGDGAAIFKSIPDGLAGKHLSELVPDIRLKARSPGSNVAYATFIGRRNQWLEYCALDSAGRSFPVELLMDVLVVDLHYLILLWVRAPVRRYGAREIASAEGRVPVHA